MKRIILGVFLFVLFALSYYILHTTYYPPVTYAQTSGACSTSTTRAVVQDGLTSTTISNNLVTSSGVCIIDPKAAFAPYKIPSYADLKSLYFDQYKGPAADKVTLTGDKREGALLTEINTYNKKLIYVTGNLGINGNDLLGINKTAVVFVDGYLRFYSALPQFIYGDGNSGIVFVVQGNVYIDTAVIRVDAVIISEGIICTAYDGSTCPSTNVTAFPLVINGSLISLKQPPADNPTVSYIIFKRTLDKTGANNNSTTPAEQINHQVKYLVILRNLMSDTFQRWSEIQ